MDIYNIVHAQISYAVWGKQLTADKLNCMKWMVGFRLATGHIIAQRGAEIN